jgi:protein SCO1/2
MRYLLYGLLFLVAGAIGWLAFSWTRTFSGEEPYGVAFELVDQTGKPFTEKDLRAQPAAVFFGFTHCPEVCPTTLFELNGWLEQLGPDADKVKAYFISIDPERDTPEIINAYVSNVSKRILGVTGDPANVAAMAKGYNIYVKKVNTDDGDYTMDHTASVILLKQGGGFAGTIAYEENAETAVAKLKRLADKS